MKVDQLVGQNEVSGKTGIVVVLASLAALYMDSMLTRLLSSIGLSPLFTSIVFWGLGGAVATIVYYNFAIRYLYAVDGVKVTVERVYHKKPRPMIEFMKRDILFVGAAEEARNKHGKMKTYKAVRKTNPNKPIAIVFKRAGEKQMLVFQPNEEVLEAISEK
ncbi:MAG: hypothetical protein E7322_07745 [Clostridiales bacterium]|nr:hypothetical protein [Clostridiales bacterium]